MYWAAAKAWTTCTKSFTATHPPTSPCTAAAAAAWRCAPPAWPAPTDGPRAMAAQQQATPAGASLRPPANSPLPASGAPSNSRCSAAPAARLASTLPACQVSLDGPADDLWICLRTSHGPAAHLVRQTVLPLCIGRPTGTLTAYAPALTYLCSTRHVQQAHPSGPWRRHRLALPGLWPPGAV